MAARSRIGLRQVRSLKPGETIWDQSLTGFGARRQKSDAVAYVLFYRTKEGRQRWFTIGRHGAPWTPETAREEARRLLGDVARQRDPASEKRAARNAQTVAELCDLYLADAEAGRLVTRRRTIRARGHARSKWTIPVRSQDRFAKRRQDMDVMVGATGIEPVTPTMSR